MLTAVGADNTKGKQSYLSVKLAGVNIWTSVIDTCAEMVNLLFRFFKVFFFSICLSMFTQLGDNYLLGNYISPAHQSYFYTCPLFQQPPPILQRTVNSY